MIIQSISRALEILSLFSLSRPRWGISEMASTLGLQKGTVHNIVSTLEQKGFLQQDKETRKYFLGNKLFTLGAIMAGSLEITQKASGPAHRLAEQTSFVCRVAIWDHDAALLVLEVKQYQPEQFFAQRIGPRAVAYCSAIGRALLAYLEPSEIESYFKRTELVAYTPQTLTDPKKIQKELEKTKVRGCAINRGELTQGRASIAATIFKGERQLAGAISLTGSISELFGKKSDMTIRSLQEVAAEISSYMGYFPAAPEEGAINRR